MEKRVISTQIQEEDLKIETSLRPQRLEEYIGQEKAKRTLKYRKTESSIGIIESVLRCENIDCGIIIAMQKNIREGYPDFLMFSNHADGIKKLLGITLCFTVRIADIYWKYKHDLKKV